MIELTVYFSFEIGDRFGADTGRFGEFRLAHTDQAAGCTALRRGEDIINIIRHDLCFLNQC